MEKLKMSLTLGIICILLSACITMQLKVTKTSESSASKAKITDNLKDQILVLNNQNEKLKLNFKESNNELTKIRDEAAKNDSATVDKSNLIKKYTLMLGYTDVKGEGVVIKYVPDSQEYKNDIAKDLRDIVNELKNAGIEAVCINGQRIVNTSSIEVVKNKIEINNKEIPENFEIKAIGNSVVLYSGLTRPGGIIENIKTAGINVSINKEEKIEISKYSEI